MEPVRSNTLSKTCDNPTTSNCVTSLISDAPCLQLCSPASQTEVDNAQNKALCTLITATDLNAIDLGCLYTSTITTYSCAPGQVFVPDPSTPVGGAPGYCGILGPVGIGTFVPGVGWVVAGTSTVPVLVSIPNPTPKPTTLLGILQLIIDNTPCCDPCNPTSLNPGT